MARKDQQVCRNCRLFVKAKQCPVCNQSNFSNTWAGVIEILDPEKSEVAKKMGVKVAGKYALKVR